ncbi:MAG: phosphodiester glycosidase family protein [Acidobacteria bacterium]|nr:phosphodiester glycosidase family protein [Acidobacteriota bacterium]
MNTYIRPIYTFARSRSLFFFLCVLCNLCGQTLAQDFKTVHDGIEYAKVSKEIGGLNVNIDLLRLDLKKVRLDVHHAMDAAIGTEKTSSIAMRHGAAAAINAGFFRLDTSIFAGDAAGTLMIDGDLLSESRDSRSAILIANAPGATRVVLANLDIWANMHMGRFSYPLNGVNRERKDNEFVLYTPEFGRSTLTSSGTEYIVRRGRIVKISYSGSSPIPADGFVLSAGDKWNDDPYKRLKVTNPSRIVLRRGFDNNAGDFVAEDITNGVSQLISGSQVSLTWEKEKSNKAFAETRHPRTAVAKLNDGKFLMITVDGRSESSGGISLQDLAEYLLSLGAVDAMNLDGGGSTTMFLDGKVVNTPSDKEGERKIGDAILVTLRKKPPAKSKK